MNLKNKLIISSIVSNLSVFFSFVLPTIPCTESPNVPNPISIWKFKSLGYINAYQSNTTLRYFGITQSLTNAYLFISIGIFVLSYLVILIINKKDKKTK